MKLNNELKSVKIKGITMSLCVGTYIFLVNISFKITLKTNFIHIFEYLVQNR